MNKVKLVKAITKLYFVGALAGSAAHIITASHKLGGEGIEAMVTPLMIDGVAIIGMVMRHEEFSKRTNKIGFIVQCIMGLFSLAMNILAAHNLFGVLFGIAIVGLFIFAEWLSDQIESNSVDAEYEMQSIVTAEQQRVIDEANALAAKKAATQAKRQATIRRNRRIKAQQEKALEGLLNG